MPSGWTGPVRRAGLLLLASFMRPVLMRWSVAGNIKPTVLQFPGHPESMASAFPYVLSIQVRCCARRVPSGPCLCRFQNGAVDVWSGIDGKPRQTIACECV